MRLYLVRHAESESNISKEDLSHSLTPLTKLGKEQARRLGFFFKDKNVDTIYCSELLRAKQTMESILPHIKKYNLIFSNTINEISRGIFRFRKDFEKAILESKANYMEFRPENGENYPDVDARASEFWNALLKNHPMDDIVVISHGIFLRILITKMFNLDFKEALHFELGNASVSIFEIEDGKVKNFQLDNKNHLIEYSNY